MYLDCNATTVPHPKALKEAKRAFKVWGNPSSVYQFATEAKSFLWESRQNLSQFINSHPLELIFTSGASEANNLALKGLFDGLTSSKNHLSKKNEQSEDLQERDELIISAVEHPSIMAVADYLSKKGFKVYKIPVSREGELDEDFFNKSLSEKTLLVSIMAANNETGVLFPLKKLIERAHSKGALFHSDMVQMLSKSSVDVRDLNLDLASFSAHKCYGLKGCGMLYCKKGVPLESLIHGGSQERSRRAGTENLPGIASFAAIASEKDFFLQKNKTIQALKNNMETQILNDIPRSQVISYKQARLPNTSSILIDGVKGESLLINLDLKGFSVSVGSACSSGRQGGSSVLSAMGFTETEASSCLRISLDYRIRKKDINKFVKALKSSVEKIRSLKTTQ